MNNIAILVGNSNYDNLDSLCCCQADVSAMEILISVTGKYNSIHTIFNKTSSEMKDAIRNCLGSAEPTGEIFFYFTGHGHQNLDDFFYCATDFDLRRPNETGRANGDLHQLLRTFNAEIVVKVIDACNSGTVLYKGDGNFLNDPKGAFKNIIQISSCLQTQSALTGDPLSLFTDSFQHAALSKKEGTIYYTDIIAVLRDKFIGNNYQTPHFFTQCTGREQFADDARRLDPLRDKILPNLASGEEENSQEEAICTYVSSADRLMSQESQFTNRQDAQRFIDNFVGMILSDIDSDVFFPQYFQIKSIKHSSFNELAAKEFMVPILSREDRPDNFVSAGFSRKKRAGLLGGNFLDEMTRSISGLYGYDDDDIERMYLNLNCKVENVQCRINFEPKYKILQNIVLVISCAPSFNTCYVFENLTRHARTDWDECDVRGKDINKRWYRLGWYDSPDVVVQKITSYVRKEIEQYVEKQASG